jgi:LysR family transcriptional regulator, benzoate and cis,cis-muconate-responsive activator of ben and cat genes
MPIDHVLLSNIEYMKPFRYHQFDLRQLTSFAEIVRIGSYRGAAKTLHIAQPALSRQIQNLESALGVVLFERGLRRLRLTAEGHELAARLPGLFAHIDRITECTQFASRGTAGHLRVGDAGIATTEVLLPSLRILRKRWPDLRLSFYQNTSEGFFSDLIEDKIDCAFTMLPSSHPDLASRRLISLEVGIVLPPGHRLAKQKEISLGDLRDESWIMAPRAANALLYDEIIGCCHRAGFSPRIIDEVSPRPRVISQVACGVAVTTLIESVKHLCIGGTTYRRLVQPTPRITCYLVYRRNDSSALLQALISLCRTHAR